MKTIAAPAIASVFLLLSLLSFWQRPNMQSDGILTLPKAQNGMVVKFPTRGLAHLTILKDGELIYQGTSISRESLPGALGNWTSTNESDHSSLRISLHPDTPMKHLREAYDSIQNVGLHQLYFAVDIEPNGA